MYLQVKAHRIWVCKIFSLTVSRLREQWPSLLVFCVQNWSKACPCLLSFGTCCTCGSSRFILRSMYWRAFLAGLRTWIANRRVPPETSWLLSRWFSLVAGLGIRGSRLLIWSAWLRWILETARVVSSLLRPRTGLKVYRPSLIVCTCHRFDCIPCYCILRTSLGRFWEVS